MQAGFEQDLHRGVRPRMRRERAVEVDRSENAESGLSLIQRLRASAMDALDKLVLAAIDEIDESSNDDELDDAIDRLLTDEEYLTARNTLGEVCSFEGIVEAVANPQSTAPQLFVRLTADRDAQVNILQAGVIEASIRICTLQFLVHQAEATPPVPQTPNRTARLPPLWFLSKPGMPIEFQRSFLGREKADICVDIFWALLQRNIRHGTEAAPWLVAGLATRWRASSYEYLRLVANLPGAVLPTADVLHPEDVLGSGLTAVAQKAEEGYQVRLRDARTRDRTSVISSGDLGDS
jgi:hypothetical protein